MPEMHHSKQQPAQINIKAQPLQPQPPHYHPILTTLLPYLSYTYTALAHQEIKPRSSY